jgi:uncharacterized protein (TIGR02145 family)
MKRSILYTIAAAVAAIAIVGCDGDFGERSDNMDAFLDMFHYNKKAVKKFHITYNGNGSTSGEAPIDEMSPYDSGTVVLIKDKGTLKNGNAMFTRWNSSTDGKGEYNCIYNSQFQLNENVIFYAQWDTSMTFEATVTSSLAGTFAHGSGNYKPGDPVIITAGTPPDGWKFQNWTTASKGVDFVDAENAGTSFIMPENKVTVTATFVATDGKIGIFTDKRDEKTYVTVTIAEQTWMARNLDYLNDMTTGDSSWCYNNEPDNCGAYGRLYTWNAAMTACPAGWRLPDTADWNRLVYAAGGGDVAGKKLKSKTGWEYSYNNGGIVNSDDYGFSALPGGDRNTDGKFSYVGYNGDYWTATESGAVYAYRRDVNYGNDNVYEDANLKELGYSVRCVGDD